MKNSKEELNARQKEMYSFIVRFCEEHDYPPTVREICSATGIKSTSNVHAYLKVLENKGYIRRASAHQRTISVIKQISASSEENYKVPIVGAAAAGNPIFAFDDVNGYLTLSAEFLCGEDARDVFALRAEGESMIKAGIMNGDLIIINKRLTVNNGDIGVVRVSAVYGDAATIKRIFRERDFVRLQPENDGMKAVTVPFDSVEIIGRVTGLIRKY